MVSLLIRCKIALHNYDELDRHKGSYQFIGGQEAQTYVIFDAAGNLTSVPSTDGSPNHKFVYDYRNRLIEVKTQADASVASYRYDGLITRRPFLGWVLASLTAADIVALTAALWEPVARS